MTTETVLKDLIIRDFATQEQFEQTAAAGEIGENDLSLTPDIRAVVLTANTVELATNTIYNAGELAALTITLPATTDSTYVSQLNFTSGATATAFTAPDTIKWAGDDITENAFVPATGKRYTVMFYSDNVNIRAIVQGVE